MKKVSRKDLNEDLYKIYQREKVIFICETCGKETVTNCGSFYQFINIKNGFSLDCRSCLASKVFTSKRESLEENQLISSKEEVFFKKIERKKKLKFYCEDCGKECLEDKNFIITKPRLLCEKCGRKFISQKRFGVDNPLKLNQKKGCEVTHTKKGIEITRAGLVRNLWHKNFNDRKKTFESLGWELLDVNFETNILRVKRNCCGFIKELEMGTEKSQKWKCSCSKSGFSSIRETEFYNYVKQAFPNSKIVQSYKGWCIDKSVKITNRYEIDVYFEYEKFGIEFNGNYWHDKNNPVRENLKIKRATDVGIKLINIWEDEWLKNKTSCLEKVKEEYYEWTKNFEKRE